jgi:asparagine synthase (glutamine-hydrolysing)
MCGIFGLVKAPETVDQAAALTTMAGLLRHRGPDHTGMLIDPGAAVGMNRLAIIDLDTGNQPLLNEDESLAIVFNGEIYNYQELRADLLARGHRFRSSADTEVILHGYEQWGEEVLKRLNGMFAFAILDRTAQTLFLARDPLGIKPLYYAAFGGGLAFASEAKALTAVVPDTRQPDWNVIGQYLLFGYCPDGGSPFAGIRKLPAGHAGWFRGGTFSPVRYAWPHFGGGTVPADPQAQLMTVLERAVDMELVSDVPLGVLLSGGLDSSAVALLARRRREAPLRAFILRFPEASHDESADARLVATHLGLSVDELVFDEALARQMLREVAATLDEPFADPTLLPLLAICRHARREVKVVLTGWGGDELFAGYPTYLAHRLARIYRALPKALRQGLIPWFVDRLPVSQGYMSFEFKAKRFIRGSELPPELQHCLWMGYFDPAGLGDLLTPEIAGRLETSPLAPALGMLGELTETDVVDRIMHLDTRLFLEGNGLFQADRMSMAASLEARVPLLNATVRAFAAPLPAGVKMRGGRIKGLLRESLRPWLPPRIIDKPKKGFGPPGAAWLRGFLGETMEAVLAPARLAGQGVLRPEAVWRLIREHKHGAADHGRVLWALLGFQLWYDRHILQRPFLPGCED